MNISIHRVSFIFRRKTDLNKKILEKVLDLFKKILEEENTILDSFWKIPDHFKGTKTCASLSWNFIFVSQS